MLQAVKCFCTVNIEIFATVEPLYNRQVGKATLCKCQLLCASVSYFVQVSAVNDAGIGEFTDRGFTVTTLQESK